MACTLGAAGEFYKLLLVEVDGSTMAKKTIDDDRVSRLFGALADPTRRAILHRLTAGEATISELARPFEMTQQAVSLHVKVLEDAGLVSRHRVAQTRPCRLEPRQLEVAADWITEQRDLWAARHDRLEQHLADLAKTPKRATS